MAGLDETGRSQVTIELAARFIFSPREGAFIEGSGRILGRTEQLLFLRGEIVLCSAQPWRRTKQLSVTGWSATALTALGPTAAACRISR